MYDKHVIWFYFHYLYDNSAIWWLQKNFNLNTYRVFIAWKCSQRNKNWKLILWEILGKLDLQGVKDEAELRRTRWLKFQSLFAKFLGSVSTESVNNASGVVWRQNICRSEVVKSNLKWLWPRRLSFYVRTVMIMANKIKGKSSTWNRHSVMKFAWNKQGLTDKDKEG